MGDGKGVKYVNVKWIIVFGKILKYKIDRF